MVGGGCTCRSAPFRQGGLTTGIIDERQSPVLEQAQHRLLGFGVFTVFMCPASLTGPAVC